MDPYLIITVDTHAGLWRHRIHLAAVVLGATGLAALGVLAVQAGWLR